MSEENRITISLSDAEALAYAQFLKRISYREYRVNAVDDDEAYTIQRTGAKIREALADKGYSPR